MSQPKAKLAPFVSEAKTEAERLGLTLPLASRLQEVLEPNQPTHSKNSCKIETLPRTSMGIAIKVCHIPWTNSPRISQDNDGVYPSSVCCLMPYNDCSGNLNKRKELIAKPMNEIFNSEFYWNICESWKEPRK